MKFKWWVEILDVGGVADTLEAAHAAANKALSDLSVRSVEYRIAPAIHFLDAAPLDFFNIARDSLLLADCSIDNQGDFSLFSALDDGEIKRLGAQIKLTIEAITANKPEFYINDEEFISSFTYKKGEERCQM